MSKKSRNAQAEIEVLKRMAVESPDINIKKRAIDTWSAYATAFATHEAITAITAIVRPAIGARDVDANLVEYGLETIKEIGYLNM